MNDQASRTRAALQRTTTSHTTPHFDIRFALREPSPDQGTHHHGVRDFALIETYAGALESAWTALTAMAPPSWPLSAIPPPGRILCLVTELEDIVPADPMPLCVMVPDGDDHGPGSPMRPLIILPACYRELVGWDAHFDMARCAARHEPAHAWAFLVLSALWTGADPVDIDRGIRRFFSSRGLWLFEGQAVALEAGDDRDDYWIQHAWHWCDHPEVSLFHEPYSAGFFARYLDRRLGLRPGEAFSRAISAIAARPQNGEEAGALVWQALDQSLRPVLTADNAWLDSCRAGAFMGASSLPPDEEPAVFRRYGRRRRTAVYYLSPGGSLVTLQQTGFSLSCQYFGLILDPSIRRLKVQTQSGSGRGTPVVRVGLWLESDARIGIWLPPGGCEWLLPSSNPEAAPPARWHLICALLPDARAIELEPSVPALWTLSIEAL